MGLHLDIILWSQQWTRNSATTQGDMLC